MAWLAALQDQPERALRLAGAAAAARAALGAQALAADQARLEAALDPARAALGPAAAAAFAAGQALDLAAAVQFALADAG